MNQTLEELKRQCTLAFLLSSFLGVGSNDGGRADGCI